MRFLLPLLLVLLLTACSSQLQRVPAAPDSIAGNHSLPDDALIGFYDRRTFDRICRTPYDAYVILEGKMRHDESFDVTGVKECYPNADRNEIAIEYAQSIPIHYFETNTPTRPKAEVYVVFFETHSIPHRAVVFAKAEAVASPTYQDGGERHVKVYAY